jgi:glycosyltransferase involved in cell wall biosynthesis
VTAPAPSDEPLFSIVVPTYNRAHLIGPTLDSLLSQPDPSFEVLVVDDGSTDDTGAVIKARAQQDPRLRYLWKANGERGAARNFGTANARGTYVSFFDSDDLAYPQHLPEARALITRHQRPAVFTLRYDVRKASGEVVFSIPQLGDSTGRIAPEALLDGNGLSCSGVFVRRDVALAVPFDEDRALAGTEDWVLWLRLIARYPMFENQVLTWSIVDHDSRSVNVATVRNLQRRVPLPRQLLEHDESFLRAFGRRGLDRVQAEMESYAALHVAMGSGSVSATMKHLLQAGRASPRSVLRRRTLATFKHLVRTRLIGSTT